MEKMLGGPEQSFLVCTSPSMHFPLPCRSTLGSCPGVSAWLSVAGGRVCGELEMPVGQLGWPRGGRGIATTRHPPAALSVFWVQILWQAWWSHSCLVPPHLHIPPLPSLQGHRSP